MSAKLHKKIQRASLLLMFTMLLSQILGLLREWVLAQLFGAGPHTDVYFASFTIPDFINYLLAAGALSISFIPVLSALIADRGGEAGKRLFQLVSSWMGLILISLIVLAEIFSHKLVLWIAPGFSLEQLNLLTQLLRIILPAQFFFYWGGLAIAVQFTHEKFLIPSLAPVIYNLGIIGLGCLFSQKLGVMGFSIGVLVGASISHGLLQWIGLRKLGYRIVPTFSFDAISAQAFRRYLWLSLPIMLGFSIVAADEWIIKVLASSMGAGAVSWLAYARKEMLVPVVLIGRAVGLASFPYLANFWNRGEYEQYGKTLLREVQKLWAVAPLAAIVLYDQALPITHAIFGTTAFTQDDYYKTADALRYFSLGVFFWAVQTVLSRGFYASQKTWLPTVIGTVVALGAIPLYLFLSKHMGYVGLALGSSVAMAIYGMGLWLCLLRHIKKSAPSLSFKPFHQFCLQWVGVILLVKGISMGISQWGLYQQTQSTAILSALLSIVTVAVVGMIFLRTYFCRFTGDPLV